MILLDGIGDRSYPAFDHRTPLQAARTPTLDRMARMGSSGLYHAAEPGLALPSENAHFAMFGYDLAAFPGRGALEALGAGIDISAGETAILAHFVSVRVQDDGVLMLEEGKPQVSDDEIQQLIQAVGRFSTDGVEIRLHPTHGFRGILTLSGNTLPYITDSDPITNHRPLVAVTPWADYQEDPAVRTTARALTGYIRWVYRSLKDHPVNQARRRAGRPPLNALVTQRAGRLKAVVPMGEAFGLRGLSIASGLVYHGLAAYLGMDVRKVADSGKAGDDLARRITMAVDLLPDYDFIHVHTKAPDEAAHTKDPAAKRRAIEALDQGIGKVLDGLMGVPDLLVVVAADHSTPSGGPLVHSGEVVPLVFAGPGIRRDKVQAYDEISAAGGALGSVRGKALMYLILNHLDRAKLQGIMDTPVNQPFWPGRYEPLRLDPGGAMQEKVVADDE